MRLFQFGILFFRDLIFYKNETLNKNLIFNNKKDKIKLLNSKYQDANWAQCITHLENAQNYILKNGNFQVAKLNLCQLLSFCQGFCKGFCKFRTTTQPPDWTALATRVQFVVLRLARQPTLKSLMHCWPGNIRMSSGELLNIVW